MHWLLFAIDSFSTKNLGTVNSFPDLQSGFVSMLKQKSSFGDLLKVVGLFYITSR